MFGADGRVRGVKATGNTIDPGKPRTLVAIQDAKFRVIHYYDHNGKPVSQIVMEMNGEYYAPVNSIEWVAGLRQVSQWMKDKIRDFDLQNISEELPKNDSVDVINNSHNPVASRIAAETDAILKGRA